MKKWDCPTRLAIIHFTFCSPKALHASCLPCVPHCRRGAQSPNLEREKRAGEVILGRLLSDADADGTRLFTVSVKVCLVALLVYFCFVVLLVAWQKTFAPCVYWRFIIFMWIIIEFFFSNFCSCACFKSIKQPNTQIPTLPTFPSSETGPGVFAM